MHLIEIPERELKFSVPEDLSECNVEQYINLSGLMYKYQNGLSLHEFLIQATYYLLNLEKKESDDEEIELHKHSNINQVSELFLSFFEEVAFEDKKALQIKLYFMHNPIPSFKGALKNYYGPSDNMQNTTFGEYVDALDPYEDFHETKDIKYLYRLLAIFYRPKRADYLSVKKLFSFSGDKRERYNPNQVSRLAGIFEVQHIGIVYGFYLFFASFQRYITTAKAYVQGKEIDFSILFDDTLGKKVKQSDVPGIGMRSMMYSMAESGVFGELEKVRNTPFWEMYLRFYDIRKRDLDMQANEPVKKD